MDTFRVIALRHVLKMSDRQIARILSIIDANKIHLLNSIDIAYFTRLGFPIRQLELTTFKSIDSWAYSRGYTTYLRLKENQFIRFGRSWDKMVKRITKNLIIKRHDKH